MGVYRALAVHCVVQCTAGYRQVRTGQASSRRYRAGSKARHARSEGSGYTWAAIWREYWVQQLAVEFSGCDKYSLLGRWHASAVPSTQQPDTRPLPTSILKLPPMRIPQPWSAQLMYMYVLRGQSALVRVHYIRALFQFWGRNWWHRGGPAAGAGLCPVLDQSCQTVQ